jgi:hypothetical protein
MFILLTGPIPCRQAATTSSSLAVARRGLSPPREPQGGQSDGKHRRTRAYLLTEAVIKLPCDPAIHSNASLDQEDDAGSDDDRAKTEPARATGTVPVAGIRVL